jgi:uncharacterized membrane protein YdbT with pleckstrin-like domain
MLKFLSIIVTILFLSASSAFSQSVEMADSMQAQGKINVVVAVAFLVLAILFAWLIRMEFRVRRMEKEQGTRS